MDTTVIERANEMMNRNLEHILEQDMPIGESSIGSFDFKNLKCILDKYDAVLLDTNVLYPHVYAPLGNIFSTNYLQFLYEKEREEIKMCRDGPKSKRLVLIENEIKRTKEQFHYYGKNIRNIIKNSQNFYINNKVADELEVVGEDVAKFKKGIRDYGNGKRNTAKLHNERFEEFIRNYHERYTTGIFLYLKENNKIINSPHLADIHFYNNELYDELTKCFSQLKDISCSGTDKSLFIDSCYLSYFNKDVAIFSFDGDIREIFENFYNSKSCLRFVESHWIRRVALRGLGILGNIKSA